MHHEAMRRGWKKLNRWDEGKQIVYDLLNGFGGEIYFMKSESDTTSDQQRCCAIQLELLCEIDIVLRLMVE